MAMACCSSCHRHVLASAAECPFCRGAVKHCWSAGTLVTHTLVGVSLIAGSAVLAACPAYGGPMPPRTTPLPGGTASAVPTTPPSDLPSPRP